MYSKHRLEALSDGIFAIVMTLLILDIKVPANTPRGELWHAIAQESHTWVSLAVTFGISARYWVLQHKLFDMLDHVTKRTVVMTFLFLLLITVLPFSTSLWGHNSNEPIAFFLYFVNQALIGAVILVELVMAERGSNLRTGVAIARLRNGSLVMVTTMSAAAVAAWFLPARFVGIIAALIAIAGRRTIARLEKAA